MIGIKSLQRHHDFSIRNSFWGDILLEGDTLLEANCLLQATCLLKANCVLEANCLLEVKPLREAKSIGFRVSGLLLGALCARALLQLV